MLRSGRSTFQLNTHITRISARMQTHIPFNSFLPHLLFWLEWWQANANQPRSTWQRWYKVLEVTLRKTVCHTKCGWTAYRFIQSKMPSWIPRQVTDNVCSSITKWINHAVFLISVTAAQFRKLVGGERCAAPAGGNLQTSVKQGRRAGGPVPGEWPPV